MWFSFKVDTGRRDFLILKILRRNDLEKYIWTVKIPNNFDGIN